MNAIQTVFENNDLLIYIVSYIVIPVYDLEVWINKIFNLKISHSSLEFDYYKNNMNYYVESYDYLTKKYNEINWEYLSSNIYAIELHEKNLDKVNWKNLSSNYKAISILEKNINKIDWYKITYNIKADNIIKNNLNNIKDWEFIGYNINCIDIIDKYFDKIDFTNIVCNEKAVYLQKYENFILQYSGYIKTPLFEKNNKYLEQNYENDYLWESFFLNKNAYIIFEKYESKINWKILLNSDYFIEAMRIPNMHPFILRNYKKIGFDYLSFCTCPDTIKLLKENIDNIHWTLLSQNESVLVVDLLENNPDKIDFERISKNKNNNIIKILNKYLDKINWSELSANNCDEAVKILKMYPNRIDYNKLIGNNNLEAIKLYYNYYIENKSNIDNYNVALWVHMTIPTNKKIFVKNEIETNKRIDDFIEKYLPTENQ